MVDNNEKGGFPTGGFPASQGFPTQKGFSVAPATGFPAMGGFPSSGFPSMKAEETVEETVNNTAEDKAKETAKNTAKDTTNHVEDGPKAGNVPKNVKYFDGMTKLNKTDTNNTWKEFGGDRLATVEKDGSAFITRIVERESKKSGVYFKLVERLTRDADGYGVIAWRIDLGAVARRKPSKQKFDESWHDSILVKVREVVADGVPVATASKQLSAELGVSFSTMRANLWVADKWAKGETTTFLPHRSMIKSIFNLLCELGKKEETLASLEAYCKAVVKPSEFVLDIMKANGRA